MTEKLSAFDLETFMSKLVDALPKLAGAVIISRSASGSAHLSANC